MSEELLALLDRKDQLDDHHSVEGAGGTEAASIEASEVVVDPPLLLLQLLEMANHPLDVGGRPVSRELEQSSVGCRVGTDDAGDGPHLRVRHVARGEGVTNDGPATELVATRSFSLAVLRAKPTHHTNQSTQESVPSAAHPARRSNSASSVSHRHCAAASSRPVRSSSAARSVVDRHSGSSGTSATNAATDMAPSFS